MLKVKRGVRPYSIHIICAFVNASLEMGLLTALEGFKNDLVITSGEDGKHTAGSVHDEGNAVDFRTNTIDSFERKKQLRDRIGERLGPLYDCVLEDVWGPNEHLHVERDPKRGGL